MTSGITIRSVWLFAAGALLGGVVAGPFWSVGGLLAAPQNVQTARPTPVRNQNPQSGDEVLVLRHQQLRKGAHDDYYRASRAGVWPWYEKIGTRVVGQWLVVDLQGGASAEFDEAYRLARYASLEHWRATREPASIGLGGDGLDRQNSLQSGRERGGVQTGSKGAYFLQGSYADTRPLYMPGLPERYERIDGPPTPIDEVIAMRSGAVQAGREIIELRYQRIHKAAFNRFAAPTSAAVWPWEEKLGARPIGQWKVIYPDAPSRTREHPDYDEVITMTRYASRDHWQAMQPDRAVLLGGNGPDWRAWKTARDLQAALTLDTSVELLEGEMYHSPPLYTPSLGERYRIAR